MSGQNPLGESSRTQPPPARLAAVRDTTFGDHTTFQQGDLNISHLERLSLRFGSSELHSSEIEEWVEERAQCLQSLSFETIDARRHDIRPAHQGTCDWLFTTPQFHEWRDRTNLPANNGVLWIKGHPGTGKSTLMKHMLEHCQAVFKDHNIVSHFFNARGHDFERTLEGMLRSLACQFTENDTCTCKIFLESYRKKNAKHGIGNWKWRETELRNFIVSVVRSKQNNVPQQPLILLVDALDECCESQVREVVAFLEFLSAAAMSADTTLKICLSSRHYPHITMRRFQELVVERNEEHSEDIRKYVGDNLILRNQDIEASLLDKASGIFLWVVLVVALLNEAHDQGRLEAMREKLDGIPEDVEKLFENLLKTNNSKMEETVLMLQWVLFARRALKPQELYIATLVGTSPECLGSLDMEKVTFADIQRRILSTSKGLIETRSAVGTVQFIHESVRDFLLRNRRLQTLSPELQSDPIGASHDRLKACCLSYLSLVTDEAPVPAPWLAQPAAVNTRYPFLRYASQCLLRHAEIVASRNVDQLPFLVRLLESDTIIKRVRHHHMMSISSQDLVYATPAGLLHLLAGSGYLNLTETFIAGVNDVDIDTGAGDVGTALQFAVANGWQDVAETLLRNGADVNAPGGTAGTALQAAIAGKKPALVSWLLGRKDVDINAWSDACGTALQLDISQGGDNARLLLERGADVNAPAGVHGTALQAAVWRESRALVKLLLEMGANVNAPGGDFGTALQAAVSKGGGNVELVQLLLDWGAVVDSHDGDPESPLAIARRKGNGQIAGMLVRARGRSFTPPRLGAPPLP